MKYGILRYPHPNSRYFDSTKGLLECELGIIFNSINESIEFLGYEIIGGVELFAFNVEVMTDEILEMIYSVSSNYILFKIEEAGLFPMNNWKTTYFKEDMASILKYSGKTNESFTAMMINLGIYTSDFKNKNKKELTLYDPMCGRGTTLFQGLIMGYNVAGIDIDYKATSEINKFLRRYLKYHMYKHSASHQTIIMDKDRKGVKYTFETSDTVENYKKKDRRTIRFADGDTLDANLFYKKDSFHTMVTDLPYGVQHSGTSKKEFMDIGKLLEKAAVAWKIVLKKGGTVVLSYNTHNIKREVLTNIFEAAGYTVLKDGYFEKLEHWVEQAVNRDIFIAKKN